MSTLTPNHGLKVPESTDNIETVREDYAYNLGKIDEDMGGGSGSGGHTIIDPNGNSLPQESGLQFTGGVTVTDDNVNGKTVVDISGSSVVELTQAEYEALPDGKLSDDILYGLKDVKSFLDADILYLGTCYSTSERMVGCWIDGKPLYQKTIEYSGTLAENTWIAFGTIGSNENIVGMKGILTATSDNVSYIIGGFRMSEVACTLCSTSDHFELWYRRAGYGCDKITLTYQYTKTTDIAGSGTWTPSGVNAVHYDDTEKVIGTWFGETLYEKTIHIVEQSEQTNKNYTAEITSLNASHIKLKNAEVKLGADGGNAWYTAPFWYDGSYNMCVAVSPNDMNIFSRGWKYTEAYVTLQYTKSS